MSALLDFRLSAVVIVVKLYRMLVDKATDIFKRYFKSMSEDEITGRLVIITKDGIRFRTLKEITE